MLATVLHVPVEFAVGDLQPRVIGRNIIWQLTEEDSPVTTEIIPGIRAEKGEVVHLPHTELKEVVAVGEALEERQCTSPTLLSFTEKKRMALDIPGNMRTVIDGCQPPQRWPPSRRLGEKARKVGTGGTLESLTPVQNQARCQLRLRKEWGR